jgi:hypothetical protein
MRSALLVTAYVIKLTATAIGIFALAIAWPPIGELGRDLVGSQFDTWLVWLSQALEAPTNYLAGFINAAPGSSRYLWLKALLPLNVALVLWVVPSPAPASGEAA